MTAELPDALLAFVVENFESVYQLEILLYVRQHGECSADAVARALYLPPASVQEALDGLVGRALVERASGSSYRCSLGDGAAGALIDAVASRYGDYRVRIAGAIYSKREAPRASPVESFVDAFRLRRGSTPEGEGGDDG